MAYVHYDKPPSASHYEYQIQTINNKEHRTWVSWVKQQAIDRMFQMTGWCSPQKATILVDLILKNSPKVIVEIGVWGGRSLIPMAHALKMMERGKIYGIDPWDNNYSIQHVQNEANKHFWTVADHEAIRLSLVQKIDQFGLQDQVVLIQASSEQAPPIYDIDVLHIDGNHSEATSYFDVTKWVPLVKSGGWIIFDDMTWHENGTCTTQRAVDWLNEHCIQFAEFSDSCEWGLWVKK